MADELGKRQPRRSDRILVSIPLEVVGTAPSGGKFCVKATTQFVSSHGGSLVLPRTLGTDQEITMRRGDGVQVRVRVVGQVGIGPAGPIYGVAFLQPCPDFWGVSFP